MHYAFIALNVISAQQSIEQGKETAALTRQRGEMQAQQYRFQSQMTLLQSEQKSLQYKREELNMRRDAEKINENLRRANSAVIARAGAMNIQPFSGSPLDLQKYNEKVAGEEGVIARENIETTKRGGEQALRWGKLQSSEFETAAQYSVYNAYAEAANIEKQASRAAMMKIASAAFSAYQIGSAPSGPSYTGEFNPGSRISPTTEGLSFSRYTSTSGLNTSRLSSPW